MSGIVQNNILRTSGSIAVAAAGLNWSSTILTALTTFTVTVANVGGSNYYFINSVQQQTVDLLEGFTYKFDQADSSNSGHPLLFYLDAAKNTAYTTGVTTSGTPGNAGAYTQIVVASGAPTLYYQCSSHAGMGGQANTTAETVEAGKGYWIDTTSTTCTITLPSAAEKGDQIVLIDYARTWGTNAITIDSNGLNYQGDPDTLTVEYTTSGQSINIVYSDATKGWVPLEDDVTANEPVAPVTQKAIMVFGSDDNGATATGISNLISSSGVVASDTSAVATAKLMSMAATYGFDKAVYAFGDNGSNAGNTVNNSRNLVSNQGVVASTVTGAGTARNGGAATEYGTSGQAVIAFGYTASAMTNLSNLVSNQGVVASDTTGVGTARYYPAGGRYGVGLGIFGYGSNNNSVSMSNKVSSSGVIASDTSGVGTAGFARSFAPYGSGLGMFIYGNNSGYSNQTNRVSNTGVVASNGQAAGTGRMDGGASSYGGDKGIGGFGYNGSPLGQTNLISNSGVVASDTSAVGTARAKGEFAGYSNSA
jgi:hypothetical protein